MHRPTDGSAAAPHRLATAALAAFICCGCASPLPATAAPDEASDGLTRLLQERELARPDGDAVLPGFAQQVRDGASEMVLTAMNFLGVPYRSGGNGGTDNDAGGFDCSGFTRQIFKMSLGRVLPRRADEQATSAGLLKVRRDELRAGDLVFFNTLRRTFSHVGIYIGDGKFIHSPSAGGQVRIEDMGFSYWRDRFTGARRADASGPAGAAPAAEPLPAAMTRR